MGMITPGDLAGGDMPARIKYCFTVVAIGATTAIAVIAVLEEFLANGFRATLLEWQGILAGLLGLVAGSFAWFAAQRQIRAAAELERRNEIAAKALFIEEITPVIRMLDLGWTKIDQITRADTQADENRHYAAYSTLDWHFDGMLDEISAIESLVQSMDIVSRRRAEVAIEWLRRFVHRNRDASSRIEKRWTDDAPKRFAEEQRVNLSHVDEAIRRFDPTLAAAFNERVKRVVDWRPTAELLANMRNQDWPH